MTARCNLIIDSCCDLPFEVVDCKGIDLIGFPYVMSDGEHQDDLYRTTTAHEYYQAMREGEEPSTAQLSVPVLREAFQKAADSKVPTVYLSFSSGLSGSYDVAEMVLAQVMSENPDARIYLVDTRLASAAEALLVYEAIRQRARGLTAEELVEWALEARFFVNAEFMLDDLGALKRGGRIPASVAYAGAKLDVKPLLTIDLEGRLTLSGVARGRKKGVKQLADHFEKRAVSAGPGQCVVVAHADCPKDAERLKDALAKI
ncbi:MAG: DegV family EDD domain-containing protein, partial [Coriobacteriaceae bacterium]|nr:DegV family EDD domain-containing protein [Coriobacteriaceae bacterium]